MPEVEQAMQMFMEDLVALEDQHQAPLTQGMRAQLWQAVQGSGKPDHETLERAFHMMAEHVYGPPTVDESGNAADDNEWDDDDDIDADLADDEADEPDIGGRVSAVEQQIGRRLTGPERDRLAAGLDGQPWTGNVEEVAAAAGVKGFADMSHQEHNAWMAARVGELNPEPDLEVPVGQDGGVDFDSMSSDDINRYMADRAQGVEYEDVYGEAS